LGFLQSHSRTMYQKWKENITKTLSTNIALDLLGSQTSALSISLLGIGTLQAWLTGETLQEQDRKEIGNVISRGLQSQREPVIVQFKSHIDLLFSSMVQFFVDQVNVDATDFRRQLKYALLQEQPLSKVNYANFESKIIQFTTELERELQKLEIQLQLSPVKESLQSINMSVDQRKQQEKKKDNNELDIATDTKRKMNAEKSHSTQSNDSQSKHTSFTWQNSSEDSEFIVLESKETDT